MSLAAAPWPEDGLGRLNAEFDGAPICPTMLAQAQARADELGLGPVRVDTLSRSFVLAPRTDAAPGPSAPRFG